MADNSKAVDNMTGRIRQQYPKMSHDQARAKAAEHVRRVENRNKQK